MNCICVSSKGLCLTRGDTFSLDVGLCDGFEDVAEAPTEYEGKIVFRLDQDDDLPELVAQTSVVEATGESLPSPVAYLAFKLTPAQTQALPSYDLVYYVELRELAGDQDVVRLFQGKVDVSD